LLLFCLAGKSCLINISVAWQSSGSGEAAEVDFDVEAMEVRESKTARDWNFGDCGTS
jgi:hypothetical protein